MPTPDSFAIKSINAYRNVKGRYDLMMFLCRWDTDYRKDLIVTILTFFILFYSVATWNSVYDLMALALEGGIIFVQLGTELSVLPRDYRPSYGGVRYTVQPSLHIAYDEVSYLMSGVYPPKAEEELGFGRPAFAGDICKESALVSDFVDDRLMLRQDIPYNVQEAKDEAGYIRSRHQIRYIAVRVADKKQHTTNGAKLAMEGLAGDIAGEGGVTLRKSYYFDALMTAEAFRSRIFRNNIRGDKEVYTDLTTYFPVTLDFTPGGEECVRFEPEFYKKVSGHIGISTLLLTENRRVAMLCQGTTKAIGARSVVLGGSGSMDYRDVARAGYPKDFRQAVICGMAREMCEETGMQAYFDRVLRNTIITGFFRWIDRCGKPEFVGLTRADDMPFFSSKAIDGDEVVSFEEIPVQVRQPGDFVKVLDFVRENKINLGLSALMTLHRLVVIAGYNAPGSTAGQKAIYQKIADFI